jgi:hypothetical protein
MKITITNGKSREKLFPKLMITNSGTLVLFKEWGSGTILVSPNNIVGNYHTDFNMESFFDFDGEVSLTNNVND